VSLLVAAGVEEEERAHRVEIVSLEVDLLFPGSPLCLIVPVSTCLDRC
jgi:hypothetical protein